MKLVVFLNNKWLLVSTLLFLAALLSAMQAHVVNATGSYDNLLRNGSFESSGAAWSGSNGYSPYISPYFATDGGYSAALFPGPYRKNADIQQYVFIPNDSDATPYLLFDYMYFRGDPSIRL